MVGQSYSSAFGTSSGHFASFHIHSPLLVFFVCFFVLLQCCCFHAQYWGLRSCNNFYTFYCHNEWILLLPLGKNAGKLWKYFAVQLKSQINLHFLYFSWWILSQVPAAAAVVLQKSLGRRKSWRLHWALWFTEVSVGEFRRYCSQVSVGELRRYDSQRWVSASCAVMVHRGECRWVAPVWFIEVSVGELRRYGS